MPNKTYRAPRTRAVVETTTDLLFDTAFIVLKPIGKLRDRYRKNAHWHKRRAAMVQLDNCSNCKDTAKMHLHVAKPEELCDEHRHLIHYAPIQYD